MLVVVVHLDTPPVLEIEKAASGRVAALLVSERNC